MDEDISKLSDVELRTELSKHGHSVGPLTKTTRTLFEKLLKRKKGKVDKSENDVNDNKNVAERDHCKSVDANEDNCKESDVAVQQSSNFKKLYFGVFIDPKELTSNNDLQLVYNDTKEVLTILKKFKNARFKSFPDKEAAVQFSQVGPPHDIISPVKEVNGAKVLQNAVPETVFKTPTTQELVKFRKAIEQGDQDYFKDHVWSNPKYLISSSDAARILHEGSRYNALHVAVKSNKLAMCVLLLDTIQDPNFIYTLYPDDSPEINEERIKFLTDYYFNTPDKGASETPLHFAAKFGCLQIVDLLSSHPTCNRNRVNKYNQKPCDIICDRIQDASSDLKNQIANRLKSSYYVPLLRSEDCSTLARIGKPYSPVSASEYNNHDNPVPGNSGSPLDPCLTIRALAGPMSPEQADVIFKKWKATSPRHSSPKPIHESVLSPLTQLRLSDLEKGYERIGRSLSRDEDVPWTEYWPFLNSYCDLASKEGLNKLESHLKDKFMKLQQEAHFNSEMFCSECSIHGNKMESSIVSGNSSFGLTELCNNLENLHLNSRSDISLSNEPSQHSISHQRDDDQNKTFVMHKVARKIDFDTDIESPELEEPCNANNDIYTIGHSMAKIIRELLPCTFIDEVIVLQRKILSYFCPFLSKMKALNKQEPDENLHLSIADIVFQDLKDILTTNDLILFSSVLEETDVCSENIFQLCLYTDMKPHLMCIIKIVREKFADAKMISHCVCVFKSQVLFDHMERNEQNLKTDFKYESDSYDSDTSLEDELFYTPPGSVTSSIDSPRLLTPNEGPAIFIDGCRPSKRDVDVLRAIENVTICQESQPYTFYWKQLIESYAEKERTGWMTPITKKPILKQNNNKSISIISPIGKTRSKADKDISSPNSYEFARNRLYSYT